MLGNRAKESSLTSGIGTVTLAGAVASYRTFGSVLSNNAKTYYTITNLDQWEVGQGTYNSNTLTRDVILSSSNAGSKITLVGQSYVFISYPAEKSVYKDHNYQVVVGSSGVLIESGTPASTTNALYNIGNSLYFNGSSVRTRPYSTKSASYSMVSSDDVIFTNSTSGSVVITLPTASGQGGKEIMIKRSSGSNLVTIQADGSETVDGSSSYIMNHQYESISLISNDSNWFIT